MATRRDARRGAAHTAGAASTSTDLGCHDGSRDGRRGRDRKAPRRRATMVSMDVDAPRSAVDPRTRHLLMAGRHCPRPRRCQIWRISAAARRPSNRPTSHRARGLEIPPDGWLARTTAGPEPLPRRGATGPATNGWSCPRPIRSHPPARRRVIGATNRASARAKAGGVLVRTDRPPGSPHDVGVLLMHDVRKRVPRRHVPSTRQLQQRPRPRPRSRGARRLRRRRGRRRSAGTERTRMIPPGGGVVPTTKRSASE